MNQSGDYDVTVEAAGDLVNAGAAIPITIF